MQSAASAAPAPAAAPQFGVLAIAAMLIVLLGWASAAHGVRMVVLAGLGFAIGLTLYQAAFGFTSAYRSLLERRGTRAVRAQLLMLAAATLLFAPALAGGTLFEREVVGAVAPAGVPVAIGAFLFGIGMQLAGGCGSGALYTAGGGSARMLLVLAAFCVGGFWASLHMDLWQRLPAPEAVALGDTLGWPAAVALHSAGRAATALAGGLVMGYGARIAFGCNIGAFFSGVASTSLHGWLWIAAALPGSWLALRLLRHSMQGPPEAANQQ